MIFCFPSYFYTKNEGIMTPLDMSGQDMSFPALWKWQCFLSNKRFVVVCKKASIS